MPHGNIIQGIDIPVYFKEGPITGCRLWLEPRQENEIERKTYNAIALYMVMRMKIKMKTNKIISLTLIMMLTALFIPAVSYAASEDDQVLYSVDAGDTVSFEEDDFNEVCSYSNDESADLDYVSFEIPDSDEGTLYFDYGGDDEEEVGASDEFYYDDDPAISDLTFVPNDNFTGDCKFGFEGFDQDGGSVEGTVIISVSNKNLGSADDIYITGKTGSGVPLDADSVNSRCQTMADYDLDYVIFTLPSSSEGMLYYEYVSPDDYSSAVSSSEKYYYGENSPNLSEVYFVPAGNSTADYTVSYTGYATDGTSFSGKIRISFASGAESDANPPITSESKSQYFSDVDEAYSWAAPYVDSLYTDGIVTGDINYDGTKLFRPAGSITRGDFMLLLFRSLKLQSASEADNFSDVPVGSYYYDAIASAKSLGIAQGSDNRFEPDASITREDAMVLTLRALNVTGVTVEGGNEDVLSAYSDYSSISDYAQEATKTLIQSGIITGSSDGLIHPKDNITRAESTAIIYRLVHTKQQ